MAKSGLTSRGKDREGIPVWEIQVYTGTKINGKYQRITERFHGSKRDATRRLREIQSDLDNGVNIKGGKIAFDLFAETWLKEKSVSLAPRTVAWYTQQSEKLIDVLGNTPLEAIDAPTVRKTLQAIREKTSGRNGKPSESTVKASYTVLNMILKQAENDDLIRRNPCAKVDPPKSESRERRSMTKEQYLSLLRAIESATEAEKSAYADKERHLRETGHQNKPRGAIRGIHYLANLAAVRIVHATGARPSEIFALQWKHVNFIEGCLHIEQATKTSQGGIKTTKSKAGKRDIYLDSRTLEYLASWRRFQASAANTLGIELGASSFVVCSDAFTQSDQTRFNQWWRKWAAANGFEGWEVYELRHTQVTLLLDANADVKTVQKRLGHSSAAVTLGVYAHALESNQRAAADLLPTLK